MIRNILIVVCLFVLIYSVRLNYPSYPYFDEMHFVPAAKAIVQLSDYPETTHPPLGQLLIAAAMRLLGDHSWAWRIPSLILAGLATALAGYLAFVISNNIRLFWLVSFILACDGLWITQARIALLNAPMVFFILACLVLWWQGHVNASRRQILWISSAICAGLAMACKWQGGLVVLVPCLFYLCTYHKQYSTLRLRFWFYLLGSLVIAYFSTFLIIPFIQDKDWLDIFKLQFSIPSFHISQQYVTHRDASLWSSWPFLIRPVWYGYEDQGYSIDAQTQMVDAILCVGNPFVFMLIFPALTLVIIDLCKNKSALSMLILIGTFVFWIPSGLISRYTLFHHFYPVMPFIAIAVAVLLDKMWQSPIRILKGLAAFLLVLIIFGQMFFYPLWTGLSISKSYFNMHIWSPTWM